jgi:rRNA maturation endonuclease Nob1
VDLGIQEKNKVARFRSKADKFVEFGISEEILKHYNCKGCYKWFSIGDSFEEPKFCPFCGKRRKND